METEWNIDGIADEVIEAMKEDKADIGDVDYYVHRIAYLTVFSRVPEDATLVATQVKKMVVKKYEVDAEDNPYAKAEKGKCEACGDLEALVDGHCEYCRVTSVKEEEKMKAQKKTRKPKKT